MPFNDRFEAGQKLAKALSRYRKQQPAILALPRGGVPVAAEIASALDAPLDLVLVRKIGVPFQPELAMGAVVDGDAPLIVRNEDVIDSAGIGETEFKAVCDRELAEIERRRRRYLGDANASMSPAIRRLWLMMASLPERPCGPPCAQRACEIQKARARRARRPTESIVAMREEADDVVCLEDTRSLGRLDSFTGTSDRFRTRR